MKVLYLCYDGITDFIGLSQVLPYLRGASQAGHSITVVSFEKQDRFRKFGQMVEQICQREGIEWHPRFFRSKPPLLAKLFDMLNMRSFAWLLAWRASKGNSPFELIHGRSYPATHVGAKIAQQFDIPILFDMRGFWPDQRREGGRWPDSRFLGRTLYNRWKMIEKELVAKAKHIIVLTEKARQELLRWPETKGKPISVIPCCADFDLFSFSPDLRRNTRFRLSLDDETFVLGYLGSLGTVYRHDLHFRLFDEIRRIYPPAKMLFVGREGHAHIQELAEFYDIHLSAEDVICESAERAEIPALLSAMDVGTCFIKPGFGSLGVSATKIGEYLACGLPVIANDGIGDIRSIIEHVRIAKGGILLNEAEEENISIAAVAALKLKGTDRIAVRDTAQKILSRDIALDAYNRVYGSIEQEMKSRALS